MIAANQVDVTYKYEADLASTKDLLMAAAASEDGKLTEEYVRHEKGKEKRIASFVFATHYHVCWFVAKLASADYVLDISAFTKTH